MQQEITLYHNPRCSKSREALALLTQQGITPIIRLYLEQPPTEQELATIVRQLGLSSVRALIRTKEPEYQQLALANPTLTEQQLLSSLCQCPKLIERPIMIKGDQACIGRPPHLILALLENN